MPFTARIGWSPSNFMANARDIAYPQYFLVSFEDAISNSEFLTMAASSTSLPARSIGSFEFPIQGLPIKLADNPTFADWSVTFRANRGHVIRNAFLKWSNEIINVRTMRRNLPGHYKRNNVYVAQLDDRGEIVTSIQMIGAFPTEIGEIALGHGESPPEEFTVTFAYDYWVLAPIDGSFFNVDININNNGVMVDADIDVGDVITLGSFVNLTI